VGTNDAQKETKILLIKIEMLLNLILDSLTKGLDSWILVSLGSVCVDGNGVEFVRECITAKHLLVFVGNESRLFLVALEHFSVELEDFETPFDFTTLSESAPFLGTCQ
jgi:hypothetical protein